MERISVSASKKYDILIGEGLLLKVGELIREITSCRKAAIISDSTTNRLFSETVTASLEKSGFAVSEFTIPAGEESKSAENYVRLLNSLAEEKFSRSDLIVALGGGVVGDLSGFVAATYLRGISCVQIPTTLLSAVDSSVGGKTAINLDAGKNLAGAFFQPSRVICDTEIIRNLPDDIFADGMAEIIKYGAIRSEGILDLVRDGSKKNLDKIICECVKIKRDIVANDEFDTGERQLLNLGHTPAHAIEKNSSFKVSHGSAVAIGMVLMARAAERLGLCDSGVSNELQALCELCSLPTICDFSATELAAVAMSDKKRFGDEITLVVPKRRGESVLLKVPSGEVESFFEAGLERR